MHSAGTMFTHQVTSLFAYSPPIFPIKKMASDPTIHHSKNHADIGRASTVERGIQ